MKYQKIISFFVVLTVIATFFSMPAHAALIIENGETKKTGSSSIEQRDNEFGNVVEVDKFGASNIYDMYFTGEEFSHKNEAGTPYKLYVSKENADGPRFDTIKNTGDVLIKDSCDAVGTVYMTLGADNYVNAVTDMDGNNIKFEIAFENNSCARQVGSTIDFKDFVDRGLMSTDRLAKLDYVVTYDDTNLNNPAKVSIYLNNVFYKTYNNKGWGDGKLRKFLINVQAAYTDTLDVDVYAGDMSWRTVDKGYSPNNGTGTLTATGALEAYASNFVSGQNFYVPAGTTVADILEMTSAYKTFELRNEDGTVITDKTSTESAVGKYIYSVGEGNNTEDKGLYSKIYAETATLEVNEEEHTFTAKGYTNGNAGTLLIAKYDSEGKILEEVLTIKEMEIDENTGYFEEIYTVNNYSSESKYKAFLWQMSNLTPLVDNYVEF